MKYQLQVSRSLSALSAISRHTFEIYQYAQRVTTNVQSHPKDMPAAVNKSIIYRPNPPCHSGSASLLFAIRALC